MGRKYFIRLPFSITWPPVFLHKPIKYGRVPCVYGSVSLDWMKQVSLRCDFFQDHGRFQVWNTTYPQTQLSAFLPLSVYEPVLTWEGERNLFFMTVVFKKKLHLKRLQCIRNIWHALNCLVPWSCRLPAISLPYVDLFPQINTCLWEVRRALRESLGIL